MLHRFLLGGVLVYLFARRAEAHPRLLKRGDYLLARHSVVARDLDAPKAGRQYQQRRDANTHSDDYPDPAAVPVQEERQPAFLFYPQPHARAAGGAAHPFIAAAVGAGGDHAVPATHIPEQNSVVLAQIYKSLGEAAPCGKADIA